MRITEELGYTVAEPRVLIASDYGVPQKRERAIFVGVRNDLKTVFDYDQIEKKKKKVTVEEAISDLYGIKTDDESSFVLNNAPKSDYEKLMRKDSDNVISNHFTRYPKEIVQKRMNYVPQGGNWRNVPEELWDRQRSNRHSSAYRRLKEDEVSITIDTGHMNYFHPLENRVPTVRESKTNSKFPR